MKGSALRHTALTGSSLSVSSHHASQDTYNHCIRIVDLATGGTTTLAGHGQGRDGDDGSAFFHFPMGIAIDPSGTFALVGVRRPPPYPRMAPSRYHIADGTPA